MVLMYFQLLLVITNNFHCIYRRRRSNKWERLFPLTMVEQQFVVSSINRSLLHKQLIVLKVHQNSPRHQLLGIVNFLRTVPLTHQVVMATSMTFNILFLQMNNVLISSLHPPLLLLSLPPPPSLPSLHRKVLVPMTQKLPLDPHCQYCMVQLLSPKLVGVICHSHGSQRELL